MSELVSGGNLPLPGGMLTLRVPGPFDVSALVTGASGKVGGDADFVFYNQPAAPGVRLRGDTLSVEPDRLRAGAVRVTVAVSAAEPGTPLGRLPAATLRISDQQGRPLARFEPPRPGPETVLLLAELYRRGAVWKLRAIGQGYADGLAGLARDFGVEVSEDAPAPAAPVAAPRPAAVPRPAVLADALPAPAVLAAALPAPGGLAAAPVSGLAASGAPRLTVSPAPDPEGPLALVNAARARAGAPPVVLDARLAAAARAHAATMAEAGRLGTESRDGTSLHQRITANGFAYATVGEHLVSGPRTPAELRWSAGPPGWRPRCTGRSPSARCCAAVPVRRCSCCSRARGMSWCGRARRPRRRHSSTDPPGGASRAARAGPLVALIRPGGVDLSGVPG
ncbi:TerD family protein [Streptomyces sp. NPDC001508]|uniref:TerD family protein n=1 Tax=Streptomyces sp. NPDC001508 TaxID=3154656 RepID=UPI00332B8677